MIAGLATWALLDKVSWIGELVGNDLLTGAIYVLLAGGIVVAIVSFFGCIGASREVKCMLLTVNIVLFFRSDSVFDLRRNLPIKLCNVQQNYSSTSSSCFFCS